MRVGARLAGAKLALLLWSNTTSWTTDDECLFWAGFFFHVGERMPQNRCTGMVNFEQITECQAKREIGLEKPPDSH